MNGNLPKLRGRGALLPVSSGEATKNRGPTLCPASSSISSDSCSDLLLVDEDPMKEAFEDPNNVYENGPGSKLPKFTQLPGKSKTGPIKLHISNIPSALTRKALENILSTHGNPISVFIKDVPGNQNTWGFVEFRTLSEVQAVIGNISLQPPYYMKVKIARDKEAKQVEKVEPPADNGFSSSAFEKREVTLTETKLSYGGRNPREIRSKGCSLKEDPCELSRQPFSDLRDTAHLPSKIEEQNRAYFNEVGTADSFECKKMKSGSAVVKSTEPRADDVVHPNVVLPNKMVPSSRDNDIPTLVTPYLNGPCNYCGQPTIIQCTRCRTWYCSYLCIETQWPEHKLVCRPRKIILSSNGTMTIEDVDLETSRAECATKPLQVDFELAEKKSVEEVAEPYFQKDSRRSPSSESMTREKVCDGGKSKSVTSAVDNTESVSGESRKPIMASPDPQMVPVPNVGHRGFFTTKEGFVVTDGTKQLEKKIVVREADAVDVESIASRLAIEKQSIKVEEATKPPIPRGVFTLCVILSSSPDNKFHFVTPADKIEPLFELTSRLNDFYKKSGVLIEKIAVDMACAIYFVDGWYRAKIKDVNKENVTAFFTDFGNTETFKASELMVLPDEFSNLPPFAFKIQLCSGKRGFPENAEVHLSLVKALDDGSWQVRLQSDPEPPVDDERSEAPVAKHSMETIRSAPTVEKNQPTILPLCDKTLLSGLSTRKRPLICNQIGKSLSLKQENTQSIEPPIPEKTFTPCQVLFVEPTNDGVWLVPAKSTDKLIEIMDKLNTYFANPRPKLSNATIGKICAAKFDEGNWYRAKISEIMDDKKVKILYIDFGNEACESCDELMALPDDLSSLPPACFRAVFLGNRKTFDEEAVEICPVKPLTNGSWLVRLASDPEASDKPENTPEPLKEIDSKPCALEKQQAPAKDPSSTDKTVKSPSEAETVERGNASYALSKNKFLEVNVVHREESGFLWVVTSSGFKRLVDINDILTTFCGNQVDKVQVQKNQMYGVFYSDIWCRFHVTQTDPCTGVFIDFGNIDELNPKDLRILPAELEQDPPLAIRIKLADGTSQKYLSPSLDKITVKALKKMENYILTVVEGETYPVDVTESLQQKTFVGSPKVVYPKKHLIEAVSLETTPEVLITKTFGENCLCGAIQLPGFDSLGSISDQLCSAKRDPEYRPSLNDDVIVKISNDQRLFRGYVMCIDGETVAVALTDVGIVAKPSELWLLPPELKDLPAAAIRILFEKPIPTLEFRLLGKKMKLNNILLVDDGLSAELEKLGRATIKPWAPFVEEAPILDCKLPNSTKVVITAFYSPKVVYVRPLVQECLDTLQEVLQDVAAYGLTADPLNREPVCGELVATRWSEDEQWYRGVVTKREGDKFRVTFLDFGNDTLVGMDRLKGLPPNYKKLPSTVVKIGLKDLPYSVFNQETTDLMNQFVLREIQFVATHDGDMKNVALCMASNNEGLNKLLAQKIEEGLKLLEDKHFRFEDLKFDRWEPKTTLSVIPVDTTMYDQFFAVRPSPVFTYVCDVLTPQINEHCLKPGGSPYAPRKYEVILAEFQGEWYRAFCVEFSIGQENALITFIDFGNHGHQPKHLIRPMVPEFMLPPATTRVCSIYGLPPAESLSDDVRRQLMESYNSITEVYVVEDEGDWECVVWVPQLVEKFKSLGIPVTAPVGFC